MKYLVDLEKMKTVCTDLEDVHSYMRKLALRLEESYNEIPYCMEGEYANHLKTKLEEALLDLQKDCKSLENMQYGMERMIQEYDNADIDLMEEWEISNIEQYQEDLSYTDLGETKNILNSIL